MNPASVVSLEAYAKRITAQNTPNLGSRLRYWRDNTLARLEPFCSDATFWRIGKLVRMITGEFNRRNTVWYRASSISNALKFHWAADEVRKRYRNTIFAVERSKRD